ncbi:MAG: hypothetical protein WHV66_11250 [Anaerolineales bacterium]
MADNRKQTYHVEISGLANLKLIPAASEPSEKPKRRREPFILSTELSREEKVEVVNRLIECVREL